MLKQQSTPEETGRGDDKPASEARLSMDLRVTIRPVTGTGAPPELRGLSETELARADMRVLDWLAESPERRARFATAHGEALREALSDLDANAQDRVARANTRRRRATAEIDPDIDINRLVVDVETDDINAMRKAK